MVCFNCMVEGTCPDSGSLLYHARYGNCMLDGTLPDQARNVMFHFVSFSARILLSLLGF